MILRFKSCATLPVLLHSINQPLKRSSPDARCCPNEYHRRRLRVGAERPGHIEAAAQRLCNSRREDHLTRDTAEVIKRLLGKEEVRLNRCDLGEDVDIE